MVQLVEIVCAIVALCGGMPLTVFAWVVIICEIIRTVFAIVTKYIEEH